MRLASSPGITFLDASPATFAYLTGHDKVQAHPSLGRTCREPVIPALIK